MFMGWTTQYRQDIKSAQTGQRIQYNPNQNPSKVFCRHRQAEPKIHMERERS